MLQKFHGFNIFSSAVFVGHPFAFFSAVIQIKHTCNGVNSYTVNVIFLYPEKSIGNEEVAYLFSSVIKYVGTPFLMLALSPVLMLIKGCTVKSGKAVGILGEMSGHPVHNNAYALSMAAVHKISEVIGLSVAAGRRIVSRYLISPASVIGIL